MVNWFRSTLRGLSKKPDLRATLFNFQWLMLERAVALGSALFVMIPVARYLGPGEFGVLTFTTAIAALAAPLSTLGLNHVVTKELKDHPDRTGATLGTVAFLRKAGAMLAFVLVGLWLFVQPPSDPRIKIYVALVMGANLVASVSFLQFWALAEGKIDRYSRSQIINTAAFSAIRLGMVFTGRSLTAFVVLAALEIVGQGVLTYTFYRGAKEGKVIAWSFDAALAKKLLSRSWPLLFSGLAAAVYLKLDLVMLGQLSSTAEVGIYSAAARLSELWYFVPEMLMTALFPYLLKAKKSDPEIYNRRLQQMYDCLCALGCLVALTITVLSSFIVTTLFGKDYAAAAPMLSIHVWAGVFVFMRSLLSKWIIAEDLYVFSLVTHGIGATINVVLNLYLIPRYGGIGASIATLISYSCASYFSLLAHPKTRVTFFMMTKALLWPRRLPALMSHIRTSF